MVRQLCLRIKLDCYEKIMWFPRQNDLVATTYYHVQVNMMFSRVNMMAMTKLSEPNGHKPV